MAKPALSIPSPSQDAGAMVELDAEVFETQFNRRPFYIHHRLAEHPLLQLPRLVELAQRLPPEEVEYNAGDLPVDADYVRTPRTGLSAHETIRRIEECGSWMVLKRVERDPEYRLLLDMCLDLLSAHSEPLYPGMINRQGFVFVSSPGAVTPFHMDNELNFLLQVRGSKTVHMWDPQDRFVLSEATIERFHSRFEHRNLPYREAFRTTAWVLSLEPGEGLHFPVNAPHWIKNGDAVSISFSITFETPRVRERALLYQLNDRLRKLGVSPRPVGSSMARDRLKCGFYRAWLTTKNALSRHEIGKKQRTE